MSPAALSILLATFVEEKERARALAAWSALTALGATTGILLGGAITELINWHWIFWINLPVGVVTMIAAARTVPAGERHELHRGSGPLERGLRNGEPACACLHRGRNRDLLVDEHADARRLRRGDRCSPSVS